MEAVNFEKTIDGIVLRDTRYHREAYFFVREALDHTQKAIVQSGQEGMRHVTGQELLTGIRDYALQTFGPMTMLVLEEWGIHRCEDFGELVFKMVESGLLAKTETDSRDDFKGGYDFFEAFRKPYIPQSQAAPNRLSQPDITPQSN